MSQMIFPKKMYSYAIQASNTEFNPFNPMSKRNGLEKNEEGEVILKIKKNTPFYQKLFSEKLNRNWAIFLERQTVKKKKTEVDELKKNESVTYYVYSLYLIDKNGVVYKMRPFLQDEGKVSDIPIIQKIINKWDGKKNAYARSYKERVDRDLSDLDFKVVCELIKERGLDQQKNNNMKLPPELDEELVLIKKEEEGKIISLIINWR